MPRYFFTLKWPDNEHADPEGIVLQDDGAALEYAQRIVRELKEEDGNDDPDLLMVATDDSTRRVVAISFSTGLLH
jgi:hypothetical protein